MIGMSTDDDISMSIGTYTTCHINTSMLLQVEKFVKWLWRFIVMPLLFGLIGASMRFSTLQHNSIGKACGIIFAGVLPTMHCPGLVCSQCHLRQMCANSLSSNRYSADFSHCCSTSRKTGHFLWWSRDAEGRLVTAALPAGPPV